MSVSPSDDNLLDLAEYINKIGPGPISNSRRFQGLPPDHEERAWAEYLVTQGR